MVNSLIQIQIQDKSTISLPNKYYAKKEYQTKKAM